MTAGWGPAIYLLSIESLPYASQCEEAGALWSNKIELLYLSEGFV